eukprot:371031-Amphidinium_carterae.1
MPRDATEVLGCANCASMTSGSITIDFQDLRFCPLSTHDGILHRGEHHGPIISIGMTRASHHSKMLRGEFITTR